MRVSPQITGDAVGSGRHNDKVSRWVLHVDLDQFVAAVEILRRPELRGRPVVVGGRGDPSERGVVSTASYEAREFGVRSGMPLRTAVRTCPDAVFLPVDHAAYDAASIEVMAALREFGLPVEVLGWDEAFIGVVTADPEPLAHQIRERIRDRTNLESTVGIGRNKLQAKIATSFGKPAGIGRLTDDDWFDVLGDRPPDALWGIGTKTATKLAGVGITTVRQLADADTDLLAATFGPTTGPWLRQMGQGRASARVSSEPHQARSRSREHTFQINVDDWAKVREEIGRLADTVVDDVLAEGRPVARVVVKLRFAPFFTKTHGHTLPRATTDRAALIEAAWAALDQFNDRRAVRLIGVRAEFAA